MLKQFIRWILPLVALLLIAMCLVLSPVLSSHAAAPTTHSQGGGQYQVAPHSTAPNAYWLP